MMQSDRLALPSPPLVKQVAEVVPVLPLPWPPQAPPASPLLILELSVAARAMRQSARLASPSHRPRRLRWRHHRLRLCQRRAVASGVGRLESMSFADAVFGLAGAAPAARAPPTFHRPVAFRGGHSGCSQMASTTSERPGSGLANARDRVSAGTRCVDARGWCRGSARADARGRVCAARGVWTLGRVVVASGV